jgi:hypothetical protein
VVSVEGSDDFPVGAVFDHVVVAAEGGEVGFTGWSAVGVGSSVVEVAGVGVHATADSDTGLVVGSDLADGFGVRSPAGGAGGDRIAVVVEDLVGPFGVFELSDGLAGDVSDYGCVSGEFSWIAGQFDQGGQISLDDHLTTQTLTMVVGGEEEVDEDVGADLVHGPAVTKFGELSGEFVDLAADGSHIGGRQPGSGDVAGVVRIRRRDELAVGMTSLIRQI